jgi:hypothetical protein
MSVVLSTVDSKTFLLKNLLVGWEIALLIVVIGELFKYMFVTTHKPISRPDDVSIVGELFRIRS